MAKAKGTSISKGATVSWKWGRGQATGKVVAKNSNKVEKIIKGNKIARNGSPSDPALTIKQANGKTVLKLQHEVKLKHK